MIYTETKRLAADIDAVRRHVDREANVRRLTERYRAGNLSVGPGEIFGAALYVASVARHYWEEMESRRRDEWLCDLWRAMPDAGVIQISGSTVVRVLAMLAARGIPWPVRLGLNRLVGGRISILDPEPVEALLDEWVDYAAVCSSPREFVIALLRDGVFSGGIVTASWREATYLSAAELGPKELRLALLAAVAIPRAFPSQKVGGERYMDAGPSDPLPALELYQRGVRRTVSIFLPDHTPQNRADFVGATALQIRPSEAINTGLSTTFDFRRTTIDRLIHLGYRDAKEAFDEAQELWKRLVSLHAQGRTKGIRYRCDHAAQRAALHHSFFK